MFSRGKELGNTVRVGLVISKNSLVVVPWHTWFYNAVPSERAERFPQFYSIPLHCLPFRSFLFHSLQYFNFRAINRFSGFMFLLTATRGQERCTGLTQYVLRTGPKASISLPGKFQSCL